MSTLHILRHDRWFSVHVSTTTVTITTTHTMIVTSERYLRTYTRGMCPRWRHGGEAGWSVRRWTRRSSVHPS